MKPDVRTRDVTIVAQRGAQVDAPVKFGAARAMMALAQHLQRNDCRVLLVGESDESDGTTEGIHFVGVRGDAQLYRELAKRRPLDVLIGISRADIFARASARRSLIYHHGPHPPEGVGAVRVVRAQRIPVVVVSEYSRREQSLLGVPDDLLHVVPNAYSADVFGLDAEVRRHAHRMTFAGNGVWYKGVDVAVAAHVQLRVTFPDAELHLYGTTHESYVGVAHSWPARWLNDDGTVAWRRVECEAAGVFHHGPVDQAELADAFRRASVLVMPSRLSETFGLASVEAQACGCFPVLPRSGGFPETLDEGATGLLYDDNTATGLADAVALLWRANEPSENRSVAAAEYVRRRFTIERTGAEMIRLVDGAGPVPRPWSTLARRSRLAAELAFERLRRARRAMQHVLTRQP